MKHTYNSYKVILAAAIICSAFVVKAQVKISSPYSVFGIGNLYGVSSQMNMAIGGAATAFSSPYFINPANPASYMSLDSNSFVFDGAFNLRSGTLKTLDQSQKTKFGTLSNIYFAFPVTKWWRASAGLMPYSHVGFELQSDQIIENIGEVLNTYSGNGGLNESYIGSSFSPFKNLSLGVNMSYLFGNIVKERTTTFPDSSAYINTMLRSSARLDKLNFDFGLLYRVDLKEGMYYQIGLTYKPKQNVDGRAEKLAYTYTYNASQNTETVIDTISYVVGNNDKVVLPTAFGAGFLIGTTNRWLATADFNWQRWSEFRYLGNDPGLKDNLRISIGGQYRPSPVDIGKYYERINYRAGFRFEQSYLEKDNTRIKDFGLSLGVGLPMKKSRSTMNIAVEVGTQGTTDMGLVKENYIRLTIGAALQERWFLKKRFY